MGLSLAGVIAVITVVIDIIVKVLALIYVPRNRRPQTALAWLLAIFLVPYVGVILYLIAGNWLLPKKRRDRQATINAFISRTAASVR